MLIVDHIIIDHYDENVSVPRFIDSRINDVIHLGNKTQEK